MSIGDSTRISELIWRGDNRSAIRALEEISAQSQDTTATLKVDAVDSSVSLDKVGESAGHVRDSMMGLASLVGIGAVTFGLRDMKDSATALQADSAQLMDALNQTGQAAGGAAKHLEEMAEAASTKGGFGTTENLQAITQFVRETKSATEAQHLFTLSQNIARATGEDLGQAQTVVSRAYAGSARGLQQLMGPIVNSEKATVGLTTAHDRLMDSLENEASLMGPMGQAWLREQETNNHITAQQAELAELTDKHATATQVLTAATNEFSGATSKFNQSTSGKASNLDNALHNLDEHLGTALLPTMNKFLGVGMKIADWMSDHTGTVLSFAAAFGALGAALALRSGIKAIDGLNKDIAKVITSFTRMKVGETEAGVAGQAAAEETGIAWGAVMTEMIVPVVLVGIVELIEHWKTVKHAAEDAWKGIETGAEDAWSWIKDHWELVGMIIGGPIGLGVAYAITHWDQLKGDAEDVVHFIEREFAKVEHAIEWPFEKAFSEVKGGVRDLEHIVGGIGHDIGSVFHFSQGGIVPEHFASGGIAGMQPVGTDTVPAMLTPDEGVVDTAGMSVLGSRALSMLNAGELPNMGGGGQERITIKPQSQIVLRTTDRQLGEAVVRWTLNRAARGVGNLVGGSLVTGAPGLPS